MPSMNAGEDRRFALERHGMFEGETSGVAGTESSHCVVHLIASG